MIGKTIFRNRWTTLLWAAAVCYLAALVGGGLSADSPAPSDGIRLSGRPAPAAPYVMDAYTPSETNTPRAASAYAPVPAHDDMPEPVHGELPY